jgi:hypothetical protein
MNAATYFALDHTTNNPTKAGKPRTYIACNLYRIHEIRLSLTQALIDFLKPWEDSANPPSPPSLTGMMFPEYRAYMLYELTKVVLSHTTFSLEYEFGKVQVSDPQTTLSKFLQAQNNRRERAALVHRNEQTLTPLTLPYFLKLPQSTLEAFLRLVSAPMYHATFPALDVNGNLVPVSVYGYDPKHIHETFSYTKLVDWQFWEKPSEFRALLRFRQQFDSDRANRVRTSPTLERLVFNQHWLNTYADENGLVAHKSSLVDHDLHVPEVIEDLLMIQRDLQMPMNKRVNWEEIDQHAAQAYPDYRRNHDYYKVSEPRIILDVWGTAYSIKVKILLFRPENPSPLEGVRTNKDGAIESLRGLKNPFNLADIRGDFVFAMKVTLVPSHLVADEQTQTLIQQPKRQRGRPKVFKDKPHRPRPTPKPRAPKQKEEADTTPI